MEYDVQYIEEMYRIISQEYVNNYLSLSSSITISSFKFNIRESSLTVKLNICNDKWSTWEHVRLVDEVLLVNKSTQTFPSSSTTPCLQQSLASQPARPIVKNRKINFIFTHENHDFTIMSNVGDHFYKRNAKFVVVFFIVLRRTDWYVLFRRRRTPY